MRFLDARAMQVGFGILQSVCRVIMQGIQQVKVLQLRRYVAWHEASKQRKAHKPAVQTACLTLPGEQAGAVVRERPTAGKTGTCDRMKSHEHLQTCRAHSGARAPRCYGAEQAIWTAHVQAGVRLLLSLALSAPQWHAPCCKPTSQPHFSFGSELCTCART
eukprot:g61877.t1